MVASLPVLYSTGQISRPPAADHEARRWSERLTQNLVVMNGAATAVVLVSLLVSVALPFDGIVAWCLALFVLGLSSALLAMLNDLSKLYESLPLAQSTWLRGLRGIFRRVDSFWLLFVALFSFVFGAACALIVLATVPVASTFPPGQAAAVSAGAPAAGPAPPALTRAAVRYWESELANALLGGDRGLFLASCASLAELHARSGICDLGAQR